MIDFEISNAFPNLNSIELPTLCGMIDMTNKLHTDQYVFYTGWPFYGKPFVSLVLRMT